MISIGYPCMVYSVLFSFNYDSIINIYNITCIPFIFSLWQRESILDIKHFRTGISFVLKCSVLLHLVDLPNSIPSGRGISSVDDW
jgi:hypothetical protein